MSPILNPGGGAAGGGAQPSTLKRARYYGSAVSCPGDSTRVYLNLETKIAGDAVLNLTDTSHPVVILEGIYAVTAVFDGLASFTAGTNFGYFLELDAANSGTDIDQKTPPATAAAPSPLVATSQTFYIPAGGTIAISVKNNDVGHARDIACDEFMIQQLVAAS